MWRQKDGDKWMKREVLINARENILEKSQLEIAEILGISRTFYNQIENGTRNPSLSLAIDISKLFKIPVEVLFKKDALCDSLSTGTE